MSLKNAVKNLVVLKPGNPAVAPPPVPVTSVPTPAPNPAPITPALFQPKFGTGSSKGSPVKNDGGGGDDVG